MAAPSATFSSPAPSTAYKPIATALVQAPPMSVHAPTFAGSTVRPTSNRQELLVKSAGTSALQWTGNSHARWIADGQKMDPVSINGTLTTIVFRPGASASSLTVNAAGNTMYLPAGSPIKVEGAFASQTAVSFYAPI